MVAVNNYEGMLLLDNRFASRDWVDCESDIGEMLAKHGGSVLRARRWGERKLAYEIKGHKRATYMLVYFQMPPSNISHLLRDFELSENVIRNLIRHREPEKMEELLEADEAEVARLEQEALETPETGTTVAAEEQAAEEPAAEGGAETPAEAEASAEAEAPAEEPAASEESKEAD